MNRIASIGLSALMILLAPDYRAKANDIGAREAAAFSACFEREAINKVIGGYSAGYASKLAFAYCIEPYFAYFNVVKDATSKEYADRMSDELRATTIEAWNRKIVLGR